MFTEQPFIKYFLLLASNTLICIGMLFVLHINIYDNNLKRSDHAKK